MSRKNKLIPALALLMGIAFVVVMVTVKQPPERTDKQAAPTPARFIEARPMTFRTEARGFGQVLPAQSWKAVANVGGRIVWQHPDLESGNLIPVRRDSLNARLARSESALATARKDLEDTRFEAPWDMRVHQSETETGQHISPGQTLFIADNITAAEATIQPLARAADPGHQQPGPGNPDGSGDDYRGEALPQCQPASPAAPGAEHVCGGHRCRATAPAGRNQHPGHGGHSP